MKITDVRVKKVSKEGKMKAVVSITIDDEFVIHDIKVIEGDKGLFIAMPSKKAADGEYRDIAHPINSDTRARIQNEILEKYQIALSEEDSYSFLYTKAAIMNIIMAAFTFCIIFSDIVKSGDFINDKLHGSKNFFCIFRYFPRFVCEERIVSSAELQITAVFIN